MALGREASVSLEKLPTRTGRQQYASFVRRPYIFDALQLLESAPAEYFPDSRKPDSLDFVHLPIVDCATVGDSKVFSLAKDLCRRLKAGENLYVHCWGGHGRTGTVLSLMLGLVYGMAPMEAMAWVQMFHDCRIAPCGVPSPQTAEQRKQVTRILVKLAKKRDAEAAHSAAQQVAQEAARAKARQAAEAAARHSVAAATASKHAAEDPFAHYRRPGGVGRTTPDLFGQGPTPSASGVPPVALMGGSLNTGHSNSMSGPATERLPHTSGTASHGAYQSNTARGAASSSTEGSRQLPSTNPVLAWDPTPERALSRAKSPDTARAGSGLGRSTPGSPPPARRSSSGGQARAPSRTSIETPPLPQNLVHMPSKQMGMGFTVPQQPPREDSMDVKPSGKLRRTGRSYEPVARTRGEAVSAEASMSSVTSDLPPMAQSEHADAGAGGRPQAPASRVHLPSAHSTSTTVPSATKMPSLPLGGVGSSKPGSSIGGTLPSTGSAGSASLMWKQPEVESWVNRLSGRRKPKSSSTSSSRSTSTKPSSDVLRLARRSRRKRDGEADSTAGSSTGGFAHVRSKVPSRRIGGKKKTRSGSKRKGKRSSSRTGSRATIDPPSGSITVPSTQGQGAASGGGSLLGVLPSIPDGRPGSGVVAGAGLRGMGSVGNTRSMLSSAQPTGAGGMLGYSHHQAAMASAASVAAISERTEGSSTGTPSTTSITDAAAPREHTQSTRRHGAMQSHRRLVGAQAARKTSAVASRGTQGARSLKPPPVSVG